MGETTSPGNDPHQLLEKLTAHLNQKKPTDPLPSMVEFLFFHSAQQLYNTSEFNLLPALMQAVRRAVQAMREQFNALPLEVWRELQTAASAVQRELEHQCDLCHQSQISPRNPRGRMGRRSGGCMRPQRSTDVPAVPKGSRMADGIEHPARLDAAVDFLHPEFTPMLNVEDALLGLSPALVERRHLLELLHDFQLDFELRSVPSHLSKDGALAIYAYTYEIKDKGSARLHFQSLRQDALYARVHSILDQERCQLSPSAYDILQATGVTAMELLHDDSGVPELQTMSPADAHALQVLRDHLSRPENDDSLPFQIYRELNAAMRGIVKDPERLAPFRDYLFHLRSALKQLKRVEGATVYRGMGLEVSPALYQPGSCVLWQAFSSTSRSISVSTDFCRTTPNAPAALFIIRSTEVYDVMALSRLPKEAELVLPPNAGLRVEGMASESVRQALGLGPRVQVLEMRQLPDWQVDAECRLERGAALVGGGNLEEGLSMWQSVADAFPGTPPALFAEASVLMWTKPPDLNTSKKLICEALSADPLNPAYYNRYAQVLAALGDAESASLMYRRALSISPAHYGTIGNYFIFLHSGGALDACRRLAPDFCRSRLWAAQLALRRGEIQPFLYNTYLALCSQPLEGAVQQQFLQALEEAGQGAKAAQLRAKGAVEALHTEAPTHTDRMVRFWYAVWFDREEGKCVRLPSIRGAASQTS
eukprot:GGOE01019609.1.p1 GENE.GGOE01019609.1~~GGOE01019609.1.p1  ORF type:complete len:707 (-),score=209.85 GGOE01019609.1:411-2531(-)